MVVKDVVEDADKTLMVLDPQGAILTRIWCLYEAWQTSRKGANDSVALNRNEGNSALVLMSYGIELEPLKDVFLNLDVARAQATVETDLHSILADIQRVGYGDGDMIQSQAPAGPALTLLYECIPLMSVKWDMIQAHAWPCWLINPPLKRGHQSDMKPMTPCFRWQRWAPAAVQTSMR